MTGETWGALALQSVHEASEGFALYAVPALVAGYLVLLRRDVTGG